MHQRACRRMAAGRRLPPVRRLLGWRGGLQRGLYQPQRQALQGCSDAVCLARLSRHAPGDAVVIRLIVLSMLAACSSPEPAAPSPVVPAAVRVGVSQVADASGMGGVYVFCVDAECTRPSRKTPAVALPVPTFVQARKVHVVPPAVRTAAAVTVDAAQVHATLDTSIQVFFARASAALDDAAHASLAAAVEALRGAPVIQVHGYTDARGSDGFNARLAERRAASVTAWLAEHGIPESRVKASSDSRCCYVAPNSTRQGRQANRRVVITFSIPVRAVP